MELAWVINLLATIALGVAAWSFNRLTNQVDKFREQIQALEIAVEVGRVKDERLEKIEEHLQRIVDRLNVVEVQAARCVACTNFSGPPRGEL